MTGNGNGATPAITAKLVTITPELAEDLIVNHNDRNRGVDHGRVMQYAADIKRGDWQVNGEAIKIAESGRVLDGQHRLLAVLEADTPIITLLIRGLPDETQETMDQGRARSFALVDGNESGRGGEHEVVALAAELEDVADGVPFLQPGVAAPTVQQLSRTLERNPEIRDSVDFMSRLRRGWLNVSAAAGLHYLFATAQPHDADPFFERLATGEGLSRTDAIYVLRERLIAEHNRQDGRRLTSKTTLAFIVRTWNAYQDGETIHRLVWTAGGANPDRFPAIAGLVTPDNEPAAVGARAGAGGGS